MDIDLVVPLEAFKRAAAVLVGDLELACKAMNVECWTGTPEEVKKNRQTLIESWAMKIYLIAIKGGTC